MSFQSPLLLFALIAIPLLVGLYWLNQRRRRAYAVRFTNLALLNQVMGKGPGFRRHLPAIVFLLGISGLLLSLARPQAVVKVPKEKASVMLAIDVSGSMAATDISPTRMEAAISAARNLIDQLPGQDSIGLIAFSSQAEVISALTTDHGAVKDALGGLGPGGATAIGDAIQLGVGQLAAVAADSKTNKKPPTILILLTDGSNNRGVDPMSAANQAEQSKIRVETVGIGARNQTTMVFGQQIDGVDEQSLQGIATATGGHYYYAADQGQLNKIYSDLGSEIGFVFKKVDITIPVVALSILVLLIGALFSLRWFRLLP